MSLLTDVLVEARRGTAVDRIAARLGADAGLVDAAVDHLRRIGTLTDTGVLLGCSSCAPDDGDRPQPVACRGCPVPGRARVTAVG